MFCTKRKIISFFIGVVFSFSFVSSLSAAENLSLSGSDNESVSPRQMKEILAQLKAKFEELRAIQKKLREELEIKDAEIETLRAQISSAASSSSQQKVPRNYQKKINDLLNKLNMKDQEIAQLNAFIKDVLRQIEELNNME